MRGLRASHVSVCEVCIGSVVIDDGEEFEAEAAAEAALYAAVAADYRSVCCDRRLCLGHAVCCSYCMEK